MDDMVRTRLILLGMAGLLLMAGCLIWVNARKSKEVVAETNLTVPLLAAKPAVKPLPVAANATGKPALPPVATTATTGTTATAPATDKAVQPIGAGPAGLPTGAQPQPKPAGAAPATPVAGKPTAGSPTVPGATEKPDPGVIGPDGKLVAIPPAPVGPTPATQRETALVQAKAKSGHSDNPCAAIKDFKPFPRFKEAEAKTELPPPEKPKEALVPPPPPNAQDSDSLPGGLSLDELPAPPAKPSLSEKLRLLAIVGDRAILTFSDKSLQRDNKWPSTVTLGSGEKFESVSVVDVSPDSVTLDEDGERSVKNIDAMK